MTTTTTCQGTWRQRYASIPESDGSVVVLRCSDCGEQEVVLGYRKFPDRGAYPPDMSADDCIRLALEERALRRG